MKTNQLGQPPYNEQMLTLVLLVDVQRIYVCCQASKVTHSDNDEVMFRSNRLCNIVWVSKDNCAGHCVATTSPPPSSTTVAALPPMTSNKDIKNTTATTNAATSICCSIRLEPSTSWSFCWFSITGILDFDMLCIVVAAGGSLVAAATARGGVVFINSAYLNLQIKVMMTTI